MTKTTLAAAAAVAIAVAALYRDGRTRQELKKLRGTPVFRNTAGLQDAKDEAEENRKFRNDVVKKTSRSGKLVSNWADW